MNYLLYTFIINSAHLFRSRLEVDKKIGAWLQYLLLTVAFPILHLLNLKKIRIYSLTLQGLEFGPVYKLFSENFVRNQYYFISSRKNPVIFDCGASIGDSLLYFKDLYPQSRVYSFEPDPETFSTLKKNIKNNHLKKVFTYNVALTDKKGITSFYVGDQTGGMQMSLVKDRLSGKSIRVKTDTLISFTKKVKKIDLLKMDIEGAELSLLWQLVKSKEISKVEELIIEYHHHVGEQPDKFGEFLTLLERSGFKYQLDTSSVPLYSKGTFQDILVYGYR